MGRDRKDVYSLSDSLESFETKSSMSGSANSVLTPPRPFGVVLAITLFFLLMASIGGLSTSAVDFQTPSEPPRYGVDQSFVLFSSLLSPIYIFFHVFVAFNNFEVSRRQSLQTPFVSWTVIVARLGLLLWAVTLILASITVARDSNTLITRSNLAISVFGVICLAVLNLTIEISSCPFELPFTPRRHTVTCPIMSFENELKRKDRHYRTMTMDSTSSRGSSRSSGSRKRFTPPPCKRCSTILEEGPHDAEPNGAAGAFGPASPRSPRGPRSPPEPISEDPPVLPELCAVPPGTAWAQDWEALANDAGMGRSETFTSYQSSIGSQDLRIQPTHLRQPPPAIIVTPSP